MRKPALVGLILLCQVAAGCSLLGKKKPNPQAARGPAESPWPTAGGGQPTPPPDRTATPAAFGGVLAGQVVDGTQRRLGGSAIQVVSAEEGAKAAPLEVLADANGYFIIQGLKAGQPYELIARAKDGERALAGRVWVRPPDPKILIRISEDLATATVPPIPSIQVPGQRSFGVGTPADNRTDGAISQQFEGTPGRSGSLGPPASSDRGQPGLGVPAPAPRSGDAPWPPNITSIPPQVNREPLADPNASPVPPATDTLPAGPPPVPSCMLLGDKLHNLALRDLDGRTWEFRQRTGKLVLLDFWYSTCAPCLQATYHLKELQTSYGPGLEVVGIAYETGNVAEQVRKVRSIAERRELNYRLLLGTGQGVPCPVRDQFRVTSYPTLILLDEQGQILKRYEGLATEQLRDLKLLLQLHLATARR